MKFALSAHRTSGRFVSGIALLALLLSSCTSTGTGPDGQALQLTANNSVLTETLQSAADQKTAQTEAEAKQTETKPGEAKPQVIAQTSAPAATSGDQPKAATVQDTAPQVQSTQTASVEKKNTSLFGFLGNSGESKPVDAATQADAPEKQAVSATEVKPQTEPVDQPERQAAAKIAQAAEPAQGASPLAATKNANAFVTPQRPNASQSSIARLFSDESTGTRSGRNVEKKLAMVKPVSTTARHDFNYTLPGVRANGGIEIKHRNSLNDDSDIDANEDDEIPGITLASAPGLGRLAPNGLKVQRETVDVACLKPELVTMLRTMERHFRRPAMVTSGYRSPSYNRKVNGARRSMHMVCAAADVQFDGVSKWEVARYARTLPGRGGVGTYCHTTSVHVDVGPERDWNWRCKG